MHRIDFQGHKDNQFTLGNPATGEEATKFGEDWPNAVQEELCNAIEAAGLVLDKEDNSQLSQVLQAATGQGGIRFSLPGLMAAANPAGGLRILARAGTVRGIGVKLDGPGASADVTVYNDGAAVYTFAALDSDGASAAAGLANTAVADLADITIGVANLVGSPANLRGYIDIG